jgi:hypothetical protein
MVGQYWAKKGLASLARSRMNSAHIPADHTESIPGGKSVISPSMLARLGVVAFPPVSEPSPNASHHLSQKAGTDRDFEWAFMYLPKCPVV